MLPVDTTQTKKRLAGLGPGRGRFVLQTGRDTVYARGFGICSSSTFDQPVNEAKPRQQAPKRSFHGLEWMLKLNNVHAAEGSRIRLPLPFISWPGCWPVLGSSSRSAPKRSPIGGPSLRATCHANMWSEERQVQGAHTALPAPSSRTSLTNGSLRHLPVKNSASHIAFACGKPIVRGISFRT